MSSIRHNLLVQFSLVTLVILSVLAVIITTSLNSGLEQTINHLEIQREIGEGRLTAVTDQYSMANLIRQTMELKFQSTLLIASGFLLLYISLYIVVRGGWRTIVSQRERLQAVNAELQRAVGQLEVANVQLLQEMADRKELEGQLLQSQKMESVGRMAGSVAHDFRNLLTPIISGVEMGRKSLSPGHPAEPHLEIVRQAANQASELTTRLLTFSRRQAIEPQVLNLNRLIEDTRGIVKGFLPPDIGMEIELAKDLDLVEVDPGQFQQILVNLVVNAIDAMPNGGGLTIKTENCETSQIPQVIELNRAADRYVLIKVIDTGEGMSNEVKAKVFEPFFTTKEPGKGTGLGLATCYGIVTQSGGHIDVNSAVGKGTTLNIFLPSAGPATNQRVEEGEGSSDGRDSSERTGATILLAEDESLVRDLMAGVLREEGYQVWEAENGEEALKVFESLEPHSVGMLLTDVVMPHMGGIELAQRVRSQQPDIPVLFASAYSPDPIDGGKGPSDELRFIQKPFLPDSLVVKVREIMDANALKAGV